MAKEYFCAYYSYHDSMSQLSDAEKGRLFEACLEYSRTGEVPQLSGNERFVFPTFKSQIDRDNRKYQEKCAQNARNATATASERKRPHANASEKSQRKGKGEGKDKGEGESIPPPPLPGGSPDLSSAFADWLKYKAERREGYKPTGLKNLQTQVLNKAGEYGDAAVAALIRECMAANYQGIIFDRLKAERSNGGNGHGREMGAGKGPDAAANDGGASGGWNLRHDLD